MKLPFSLLSLLFILPFIKLNANTEVKIQKQSITLIANELSVLVFDFPVNTLVVRSLNQVNSFDLDIRIANKSYTIQSLDEHADSIQSNLLVFESNNSIEIQSKFSQMVEIIGMYVPPISPIIAQIHRRTSCEEPENIVPQSVWRAGLPDPIPGRVKTTTHHCVVHHAASDNSNTNYTQLVRSFYTLHTQVNGWDDIGYNYLIAPNGDIYAGRDPELFFIQQHNVQGAHFCSKNTNTMGVCLIGNYTQLAPSDTMMESLEKLLTWKYVLDTLMPTKSFPHPFPSGADLPALVGHRDGCATQCPGDSVYIRLSDFRNKLQDNFNACLPWVGSVRSYSSSSFKIYNNLNQWNIDGQNIEDIEVYNVLGHKLDYTTIQTNENSITIQIASNPSQLLIFKIKQNAMWYSYKTFQF